MLSVGFTYGYSRCFPPGNKAAAIRRSTRGTRRLSIWTALVMDRRYSYEKDLRLPYPKRSAWLRMAIAAVLAGAAVANPLSAQARSPNAPDLNDRGVFELFAAGKSIGTETFSIRARSGRIEAQGEGHLRMDQNGKIIEARTSSSLSLDSRLDTISYTWSQKGTQSSQLSVDFRNRPT